MKNKNTIDEIVLSFTNTGKLPTKYVSCTTCFTNVTMFGSNLDARIKKFGTLVNLLNTFTCRKCVSSSKPKKIVIKAEKKPGKIAKEDIVYDVPKMKFSVKRDVLLSEAPDLIESVSKNGSCIRPDIYLNNDRHCDRCSLYNHCLASIKNYSKHYQVV